MPYNAWTLEKPRVPRFFQRPGVFAPLVGALVFKTSGRLEESRQWVRFPYTPAAASQSAHTAPRPPWDFAKINWVFALLRGIEIARIRDQLMETRFAITT